MNNLRVIPKSRAQLKHATTPESGQTLEAVPHCLYDTQTFKADGSSSRLDFFTSTNGDPTICNMETAGQLVSGQHFEVTRIFADVQRGVSGTAGDGAGILSDVHKLLHVARGVWSMRLGPKDIIGPIPQTMLGSSGVAAGEFGGDLSSGAGDAVQRANYPQNGGFPVAGSVIIPPNTKFGVSLIFAPGVQVTADTPVRVTLFGVLHRRIS